jgi:2-methylcitrate dehydratase PrpD
MSQTNKVSRWIKNLKWEDLPMDVIQQAKRCMLDFIGCTSGGVRSTQGRITTKLALGWGGPPEATIIGCPKGVAARHAAFANATMANALDFDDTLQGHPGCMILATVLAAAEKWNSNGKELLLASIIGYEMSVRAMGLMQPIIPRYQAMWDLGTLQAYGAAAASARLAGLSQARIANAIGIISATTIVPHPRKQRYQGEGRSMIKSAFGWASDAAIVASEATIEGLTGPGHALDDNMGFWEVKPSKDLDLESFSDRLGHRWAVLDVSFKPFPACRFLHPVLQGVQNILQRKVYKPQEIQKIEVRSFALLADEHHSIYRPLSGTDAIFSVPFTISAMIFGNGLSPDSYAENVLFDPEVLKLADRIKVLVDEEYNNAFPTQLGAQVRIYSRDGRFDEATVKNPKGAPDDPMTKEELERKFKDLTNPIFGKTQAVYISKNIDHIEECTSIKEFTRLLRGS